MKEYRQVKASDRSPDESNHYFAHIDGYEDTAWYNSDHKRWYRDTRESIGCDVIWWLEPIPKLEAAQSILSKEEAFKTISEWPDIDDFICQNVTHSMYGGEPTDNSIELAEYWEKCKTIVNAKSKSDS
jgi:hypothetical protein